MVFEAYTWHGQVDLSHHSDKVAEVGAAQEVVDFKDLNFVEFLWLCLGTESRDNCFMVHTLILSSNLIEDVGDWSPFPTFLPHLHFLSLTDNPLKFVPKFLAGEWLQVEVTQTNLPEPKPGEVARRPSPWFMARGDTSGGAAWTLGPDKEVRSGPAPDVHSRMRVRDLTKSELKGWGNLISRAEVMGDIPSGVELPPPFFG
jgi:hypothetical protein